MVGDQPSDLLAARAAGAAFVGFAARPGARARLDEAGAQVVVDQLIELAASASPQ